MMNTPLNTRCAPPPSEGGWGTCITDTVDGQFDDAPADRGPSLVVDDAPSTPLTGPLAPPPKFVEDFPLMLPTRHVFKPISPEHSVEKDDYHGGSRAVAEHFSRSTPSPFASPPIAPPANEGYREKLAKANDGPITDNDVTSADVLCGRGGGTNNHMGNRYFRALVSHYRPKYVLAKKAQKNLIARAIVSVIRAHGEDGGPSSKGGRFLKRDNETGVWYDIGDKKATEKASQALREGLASKMREVLRANEDVSQVPFQFAKNRDMTLIQSRAQDNIQMERMTGNIHYISPPSPPHKPLLKKRRVGIADIVQPS